MELNWISFDCDWHKPWRCSTYRHNLPEPNQLVWLTNGVVVTPGIRILKWITPETASKDFEFRWKHNFIFPFVKLPFYPPFELVPDATHWCAMYPPLPKLPEVKS